jgi:hypothetical protein
MSTENRYFTGKPCKYGHIASRLLSTSVCVECKQKREKTTRAKDPKRKEYMREYVKEYRKSGKGKETALRYARKWRGLPEATREEPKECECCGKTQNKSLALDHCHITGKFRGWLCNSCNLALGAAGDNKEGVIKLLEYLIRNSGE